VTKRSLIETLDDSSRVERVAQQLELVVGVAEKGLAIGKAPEAGRLVLTAVRHFADIARSASTPDDWEVVARMHAVLAPILSRLEAATGEPWTGHLDAVNQRPSRPRLPPRGKA
jgi:hypothetical protein